MNKEEKQQLYKLLKTASDSINGFQSEDFSGEPPFFYDDILQASELPEASNPAACENTVQDHTELPEKTSTLSNIAAKIKECKRCHLCASRRQTVPGTGAEKPFVLVIGEGPGEEEDKQGLPFVGPAGQLLDKMLSAIQLYRNKNCYIANIVKCRPPANRTPLPEEAEACRSFLDAQIAALKPAAILCAGSTAVKNLLHISDGVMKVHGKLFSYKDIPVVTTWHPSALLRDPSHKKDAWEDLKFFKSQLLKLNPDYDKN